MSGPDARLQCFADKRRGADSFALLVIKEHSRFTPIETRLLFSRVSLLLRFKLPELDSTSRMNLHCELVECACPAYRSNAFECLIIIIIISEAFIYMILDVSTRLCPGFTQA